MFSPQKLHPISYISGLIEAFKQNIIVIIVFLVFNFKDFDFTNIREYIVPAVLFIFFLISFIGQILKVYQTRYWIENNHFILTTGIFNKERKELDISRIQSVDTSQSMINQIVGGVQLQIKTPSDGIELSTISKSQSIELEHTIKNIQTQLDNSKIEIETNDFHNTEENNELHKKESFNEVPKKRRVFKLSIRDLILMSLTSGAIGIAIATISPIIGSVSNIIPWKSITEEMTHLANAIVLIVSIIIGVILVASYIIGAIINFIKYFGYTLTQENHQLKIQYGLFTKKNVTVPTERIQAVVEHQSYIRKLFGFTAIHVLITSDFEEKMEDDSTVGGNIMIIPFIKRKEAYRIIKALIPEMEFKPAHIGMPWRGFHRHFLIPSLVLILIGIIGLYYWSAWALFIVCIMILALIIEALLYIHLSGFQLENDEMTVQKVNLFSIKRYYLKYYKIIVLEIKPHPFLIINHLVNFTFLLS
ncbi:PH domain-containing protein, partial [Staphylococcus warneri]|uniref:PH domain-containing protein n=1 Tax=Staphylococcus warneri TaxID=1292 RepID=UPI000D1E787C